MKYFTTLIILSFVIFSCASEKKIVQDSPILNKLNDLDGKDFKLVSVYPNMNITISFEEDNVFGFGAVNRYKSKYEIDGGIFNIMPIARTKMAGQKENMEAEDKYLKILESATSYKLKGSTLTIYTSLSENAFVFEEIFDLN